MPSRREVVLVDCDVVVVGGGIAGCALAATLARQGLGVMVLERQEMYEDQVRGEGLWPWGVQEAMTLGLHQPLLHASGGHHVGELVDYQDGDDPGAAEGDPIPLSLMVDGVAGALNVAHPAACQALAEVATSAGAVMRAGVKATQISPGPQPEVRFAVNGTTERVTCRLVVGADGRNSEVRRQAGITLERTPVSHVAAGLYVEELDVDAGRDVAVIGPDAFMVTFPQGDGRARLYLFYKPGGRPAFNGADGAQRFIHACASSPVPDAEAWAKAVPAGPCRTFPSNDTWTERPFDEGVVLIGDAGGYNDPLIGQGLSLALRDARAVSDVLLGGGPWSAEAFAEYGSSRAERLRRMRFVAKLSATETIAFGPSGRRLRRDVRQRIEADPTLLEGLVAMFTGPDAMGPDVCTPELYQRYLAGDAA